MAPEVYYSIEVHGGDNDALDVIETVGNFVNGLTGVGLKRGEPPTVLVRLDVADEQQAAATPVRLAEICQPIQVTVARVKTPKPQ